MYLINKKWIFDDMKHKNTDLVFLQNQIDPPRSFSLWVIVHEFRGVKSRQVALIRRRSCV